LANRVSQKRLNVKRLVSFYGIIVPI